MSKINVNTWEPESSTALTMGASGDTTTVPSGASLVVASGATINITGATQTGFPSAGFVGYTVYTSTTTWTKTDNNPTKLVVEVQAGGGGGGNNGGTGGNYNGGSGGGGAYARKFLDVTNIDTATATVGAAGAVTVAGGTSSFAKLAGSGSFTTITCAGGGGGDSAPTPGTSQGDGGVGAAVPTTGDYNVGGGNGTSGGSGANNVAGNSYLGVTSHIGALGTGAAPTALGYGQGGPSGSSAVANPGAAGIVIVWEYK